MRTQDIEDILEAIAVEVVVNNRRVYTLGGLARLSEEDGKVCSMPESVLKVEPREIGLGAYKDCISEHDLCLAFIAEAVRMMPEARSVLCWRVKPEYTEFEDVKTGKAAHGMYARLGWASWSDWSRFEKEQKND